MPGSGEPEMGQSPALPSGVHVQLAARSGERIVTSMFFTITGGRGRKIQTKPKLEEWVEDTASQHVIVVPRDALPESAIRKRGKGGEVSEAGRGIMQPREITAGFL